MNSRIRLLLACALLGAGAVGLAWLSSPAPAIAKARRNCADLRVGMSEAEVESLLGAAPWYKGQLYGEWLEDIHWYATIDPRQCQSPPPGNRLYDHYQWDFGGYGPLMTHDLTIGMLLDRGKVVCFWYGEVHEIGFQLQKVFRLLSLNTSVLSHRSGGTSHDRRTGP